MTTKLIRGHVLTQGDITGRQLDHALAEHFPGGVDFCYTDPPWGSGNLKYWATMNEKMTGTVRDALEQQELEKRVVDLICTHVNHHAFIVYGVREAESIMALLRANKRVADVQYIEKRYRGGDGWLKNCVIAVNFVGSEPVDWVPILTGQDGLAGLRVICDKFKGRFTTCLDVFIGIGYYLSTLDACGFRVVGNELNAARLSKAIGKVEKRSA